MAGGYNHYWDCTCPWCIHRRTTSVPVLRSSVRSTYSYASLTNPNARCPVCREPVFFYKSPDGGRVFFDELGPPWPKHPCTDNSPAPRIPRVKTSRTADQPEWDRDGWTPLRVVSLIEGVFEVGRRKISDWWVLEARDLRTGRALRVLLDADIGVRADDLLYISEWDERGMAVLSWLSGSAGEAFEYFAWHPDHFAGITIAQFHEFDDLPSEERGAAALAALIESLPRERDYAYYDKRSKEHILEEIVEATSEAQRDGWQRRREGVLRMEGAVRGALGYWNRGWLDPTMTVVRAFY